MPEVLKNTLQDDLSRAVFLDYLDRLAQAENALADAQEAARMQRQTIKALRSAMQDDGINVAAFDRARAAAQGSSEERDAEESSFLEYMSWQKKPIGFQGAMALVRNQPAEPPTFDEDELRAIGERGMEAGKAGRERRDKPETPGTAAFAAWDENWERGFATRPPKRGPGRPKKIVPEDGGDDATNRAKEPEMAAA
jgi:hypothetical protein